MLDENEDSAPWALPGEVALRGEIDALRSKIDALDAAARIQQCENEALWRRIDATQNELREMRLNVARLVGYATSAERHALLAGDRRFQAMSAVPAAVQPGIPE
jgi:hypothetical protein